MSYRLEMKRRIGRLTKRLAFPQPRRLILLYHAVGTSAWAMQTQLFRRQMEYLAGAANLLRLDGLVKPINAEPLQIAITFDDGYASLHDIVRPIARDLGIRPAVFLNTGWISDHERRPSRPDLGHYEGEAFMSWCDVEALAKDGWQIGSHGVEHVDLTRQSNERVKTELEQSKGAIETRLSLPCEAFAYTWGRHSAAVRAHVRQAGYQTALTTMHAPLGDADDLLRLPRIDVHSGYSFEDFVAVVNGDWDYLGWIQATRALASSIAHR